MRRFIKGHGLMLAGVLLLGGCVSAPRYDSRRAVDLKELCEQRHLQWHWDTISQVVTVSRDETSASALVGSDVVVAGGQRVVLSAPLRIVRSKVMVPPDFEAKVLSLFAPATRRPRTARRGIKIVLDPGHGGKDPGAAGQGGVKEKNIVLDIAQRLKRELEQRGFSVVLTRDRDVFISLAERTEIATRQQADLFVSIHANSSPSRSATGSEVYSLRNLTADEKREAQREKNHQTLFRGLDMDRNNADVKGTIEDLLYQYKQAESPALAGSIARSLSVSARIEDRGIRQSAFFVLRNTLIPAVLVEVGFVSNAREERLLNTSEHRQKVVEGLADGIAAAVSRDW